MAFSGEAEQLDGTRVAKRKTSVDCATQFGASASYIQIDAIEELLMI